MKKLFAIFAVLMIVFIMSGCGYENDYPLVRIDPSRCERYIEIDIANNARFDRFERFDDETGTKLVLYFNKKGDNEQ